METKDIERVIKIARRFLPPKLDVENIALDVLIESWQNGVEQPSVSFIRNRCYDAMRKDKLDLKIKETFVQTHSEETAGDQQSVEESDLMTKLTSVLTTEQKKLIWYRFYQELSLKQIGEKIGLSPNCVSEIIKEALFRMRQEASR